VNNSCSIETTCNGPLQAIATNITANLEGTA
jgi:hypothetical protein